jgi:protein-tyrosine phosphatase
MIDIHSHILPGLDDGARTLEESVAMLQIAAEAGTTDIVATPHANLEYQFQPEVVSQRIAELSAAAGSTPRVHRGCDFHLSYDNIQDAIANPTKYTISNKAYLLVEFSDLLIFKTTEEIFGRLKEAGMVPVITHPERNPLLQQRPERLQAWTESGCLLQVTGQSFLGRFGNRAREFAESLVRRGLVHIVASDAHDAEDRTPELGSAYSYVARKFGEECAERLFVANPRAVLAGEPLEPAPAAESAKRRKWRRFWN